MSGETSGVGRPIPVLLDNPLCGILDDAIGHVVKIDQSIVYTHRHRSFPCQCVVAVVLVIKHKLSTSDRLRRVIAGVGAHRQFRALVITDDCHDADAVNALFGKRVVVVAFSTGSYAGCTADLLLVNEEHQVNVLAQRAAVECLDRSSSLQSGTHRAGSIIVHNEVLRDGRSLVVSQCSAGVQANEVFAVRERHYLGGRSRREVNLEQLARPVGIVCPVHAV